MTREHTAFVSSGDLAGTEVYSSEEDRVGTIDRVMIHKRTGRVAYAVMTLEDASRTGNVERPVPWSGLRYDPGKGGFVMLMTRAQLRNAPETAEDWQRNHDWERRTHEHFEATPYW